MYSAEKTIATLDGMSKKQWIFLRAAIDEQFERISKDNILNSDDVQDVERLEKDPILRLAIR